MVFAFAACAPGAAQPVAPVVIAVTPAAAPPPPPAEPAAPRRVPTLTPEQREVLRKQQEAAARYRREHPWSPPSATKWQNAIDSYVPTITPSAQRLLGSAVVPFATYLNGIHDRIHPIFADSYLGYLDESLPKTDPQNDQKLVTRLEVVFTDDGHIRRMGVVKTSGVAQFDAAALESFARAEPFGSTPRGIRSADGDVYIQWEFHRDEVFACSTMHARPFLLGANASP